MLSRRAAWAITLAATLTMTVSYVDRVTLSVLAPTVTKELDISETGFGWLLSAFSVAYLFGTPLGGWWIDRVGARRGLVVSLCAWSAVAGMHALVPGFGVLLGLRLALGVAEGPSFPGAAQTVQRVLPPAERARGFGVLFTGSSVGGLVAPLVAAWIYRNAGWRVAFLGTTAVGLAWIPLWLLVTRGATARAALDARAAAPVARPPLGQLLRDPAMIRALVAVLAAAPLMGFVQGWGAKYLTRTFGVHQADVGGYLWLPPLVFDAGAILFGDLASRARRMMPALFAIAMLLGATMALLPLARSPWTAMLILSISLAGGGGMYTLVTSDLLARTPPGIISFASGILAGAQSLALIVVSPIIGGSLDATHSYTTATIGLGVWALPGALIWLGWRLPPPR